MKVAIFETEHFEGAFPVIKLFDMPGNDISIITSAETGRRFHDLFRDKSHRYSWHILASGNKLRFFYSLYKQLKKIRPDLLYINTISDNHLLYAIVLRLLGIKKTVLTVHDINCLFESRFAFGYRKAIIHWGKRSLLSRIDEFNVVADTMIPYLRKKAGRRNIHNLPGAVFENEQAATAVSQSLRVVVPGSLDKRRRNYEQVFELLSLANEKKLAVDIILLGGHADQYGKTIIGRARALLPGSARLVFYDTDIVDQEEFDRQMNAAHFVFIPSVIHTAICGDIPEIYGITKSSGNIFDVIKHAKPFIIPEGLAVSEQLASSCIMYNSVDSVADFLEKIILSPAEYDNWERQALANSGNYTIAKVRQRNPGLFSEIQG